MKQKKLKLWPVKAWLLSFKKNLFLFALGARIKTWPAILAPVAMAGALAFYHKGVFRPGLWLLTALSGAFIQIAVNLFNDGLDFKQGADRSGRKGPDRLAQTGKMPFSQVQKLGLLSLALALLTGAPLILRGGWPIALLGLLSCALAYLYTGTRFSLLKTGLSEIFCFLFFGPAAVCGAYYIQSLEFRSGAVYLGIQCGLWALSLLLINHLRDEEEDQRAGRKHFVTLYGRENALFFLLAAQALIYLLCFFWLGQGLKAGAFTFFAAPLSAILIYMVCVSPPSKKYNRYLALCSLIYGLFGALWILGL